MDITGLIPNDHHEQRRMFAFLDDVDRDNTEALTAIWARLRILLDVHAEAEEKVFYPHLLEIGTGGGGTASAMSEVKDVIKDHNEIRDAVEQVGRCDVGADAWWEAVVKATWGQQRPHGGGGARGSGRAGAAQRVLAGGRQRHSPDLTERVSEVLALVAGGQSNTEIARGLGLSLKTVQNHVSHVLAKLHVRDRTQAALRMRGLWPLPHGSRGGLGPARRLVHPHPPPEHYAVT